MEDDVRARGLECLEDLVPVADAAHPGPYLAVFRALAQLDAELVETALIGVEEMEAGRTEGRAGVGRARSRWSRRRP